MFGDMDLNALRDTSQRRALEGSVEGAFEVPALHDVLPDGRETIVIGEVETCKDFNHPQGENSLGFRGTCGLVSCEDVLRQFGLNVSEDDVVRFAANRGLCHVTENPDHCGGTTPFTQAMILKEFGVPTHVEYLDNLERLSDCVESGHGIIVEVNAGILWDDPNYVGTGEANHAIVVTGVARNPHSGEIQGFFINDSGRGYPEDSGRFIDATTMRPAWEQIHGSCVVTDIVGPVQAPSGGS
jgi:hypothetical protein